MSFTSSSSDESEKKSPKKKYTCTFEGCSSAFGKPDRLQQHIRVHTGERPYKCDKCDCSYTRNFHLKRHISTAHDKDVAPQLFLCPEEGCSKQFVSLQKMRDHHRNFHLSERLKCPSCEKSFTKHQQLKIHQYQHTGILPFVCDFTGCEKRFLMPSKLKAHTKVHKGYNCDYKDCKEFFPNWTELRKHKSQVHSKVYSCSVCDKNFDRPSLLKSHMVQHQSTREVFHCPFEDCQRWCYYKKNLDKHIESFHTPGQFACRQKGCDKVFNWKASLKRHMKSHRISTSKNSDEKQPESRPARHCKTRSDKGKPKKAVAAILSGHPVSCEENNKLLRSLD